VPRLCELYPGICLTTEEKARKNLSQGSRRVPVGTMRTEYTEEQNCRSWEWILYRGADKSLTRPGRKQSTATEDFDVHIYLFIYLLS